jgi:hypothetical protein
MGMLGLLMARKVGVIVAADKLAVVVNHALDYLRG